MAALLVAQLASGVLIDGCGEFARKRVGLIGVGENLVPAVCWSAECDGSLPGEGGIALGGVVLCGEVGDGSLCRTNLGFELTAGAAPEELAVALVDEGGQFSPALSELLVQRIGGCACGSGVSDRHGLSTQVCVGGVDSIGNGMR